MAPARRRRPTPRGEHPDVSSLGVGVDASEWLTVNRHGRDRRARLEYRDAGIRRGDAIRCLSSVLEYSIVDPPERDSPGDRRQLGLSGAARYGNRGRAE